MENQKSTVVILPCREYDREEVYSKICRGVELLGGLEQFVKKGEKILLKPNLLAKVSPDKACTTHPAVFEAVGRLLKEQGYDKLTYGDSSGNHLPGLEKIAETCGIKEPADKLGIKPADFSKGTVISFPQGHIEQEFIIADGVLEADAIIDLCKMKTHMLERITGAVKNIFGAVYGFNKSAFHAKYTTAESFADMIADLNLLVRPRLHIMDGIVAMEGNGPQSGNPIHMNVLLFSADPVALDAAFCRLVDVNPALIATNVSAQNAGVGTYESENIRLIGPDGDMTFEQAVDSFGNKDFDISRSADFHGQLKSVGLLVAYCQKRPVIDTAKCVGCGICVRTCPLETKAVAFPGMKVDGHDEDEENHRIEKKGRRVVPRYDYKRCIRCYCCQEMCPQKAIYVKTPLLAKIADRNWRI